MILTVKRLSDAANCLRSADIDLVKKAKGIVPATVSTITGDVSISIAPIVMQGSGKRYYADIVTGSIYDTKTGRCASSDTRTLLIDTIGVCS